MSEKLFVDALLRTVQRFPSAVAIRPADLRTLGVPDVLGWIRLSHETRSIAIEAKVLRPLMEDPYHKGRRTGKMLKHPFMGPQISMLRKMSRAGIDAFGLVRVSADTAFRISPYAIPAKTGNFTHEELVEIAVEVQRVNGLWQFWNGGLSYGEIPGPRHRDNS